MTDVAGDYCRGEIKEHLEGQSEDTWAPRRVQMEVPRLLWRNILPRTFPAHHGHHADSNQHFLSFIILGLIFHQIKLICLYTGL